MGDNDAYLAILRELEALRKGQEVLVQEVQNLSRSQEQHARWLAERMTWLEELKSQPGNSPVSFAFQNPSGNAPPLRTPGLNTTRTSAWATGQQGAPAGTSMRSTRSNVYNPRRSMRRQSSADTSNHTFEDALEQFGSSNVSSRWSDSDSATSRQAALATFDPDGITTRPHNSINQEEQRFPSPPAPADSPNLEAWNRVGGATTKPPDTVFHCPDPPPSTSIDGTPPVQPSHAPEHAPAQPTHKAVSASPFSAAGQQTVSFDMLPPPSVPSRPSSPSQSRRRASFHPSSTSSMAMPSPSMANLPDAATMAAAAAASIPPVAVVPSSPVLLLPPGFPTSGAPTMLTHGIPQWAGSPQPFLGGPHPMGDQGQGEPAATGRFVPQAPARNNRQLATRSMHVPGTAHHNDDDEDDDDMGYGDMGNPGFRDRHVALQGTASHRPSGAGSTPTNVRSRYMDNIPLLLRHAYEAQSQDPPGHAPGYPPLQRTSLRSNQARDAFQHHKQSSDIRTTFPHNGQTLLPSGSGSFPMGTDPSTWQTLPPSPSRAAPGAAPWANGGPSLTRGSSATDPGGLPSIWTAHGNSASGEGQQGAGAAAGGSNTPGTNRAIELMSDAPPLLLKSFTHMKRPSMSDLLRPSGVQGSQVGYGSGQGPHNGDLGGDALVNMGYSGNAMYVKAVGLENQVMLGDEDDPDRPLTITDRLRLLAYGLINPEGRTKWDLFIMVLLVWVCFASPLIVCFDLNASLSKADTLAALEMTVDSLFVVDITLNFRTAYYDSMGNLVTDRTRIARHYARSWLFFDLVSVIPFDLITEGTLGFLSMLKLLRIIRVGKVLRTLRLYRLMRVTRLPRILDRIEHWLDKGVLQIMMFVMAVGLLAHLSACLFHYMALLTFFLTDSWDGTWVAKQGLVDASLAQLYVNSIYWAFTTVATVGYGDITPQNQKEKVMAIMVMASGVTLVGYVTSSITSLMSIRHSVSTKTAVKKQAVSDVLKNRQVPSALAKRVRAFFNYESTKLIREDEEALLQDLPFKLRSRFLQHAYVDTLCRMPCFVRLRPDILIDVIAQLKCVYFTDGDIISLQGDLVSDMFFVHEGKLELRVYDFPDHADPWAVLEAVNKDELAGYEYTIQGRLKRTYYFGHASAVHGGTWPGTVVARNCCELFSLSHDAIQGLAERHAHALSALLNVREPPTNAKDEDPSAFTINLLRVDLDPESIAADFPMLDPPPRKSGLGHLLGAAVKGSLGVLTTRSIHKSAGDHHVSHDGAPGSGAQDTNNNPSNRAPNTSVFSAGLNKPPNPSTGLSRFASNPRQLETSSSNVGSQQPVGENAPLLSGDVGSSASAGVGPAAAQAMGRTGMLTGMLRRSIENYAQGTAYVSADVGGVDGVEGQVSDTQPLLQR